MRAVALIVLSLTALLSASMSMAQAGNGVTRFNFWQIKENKIEALEAGVKVHNEIHRMHGDPLAHHTWEIVSGPRRGEWIRESHRASWAEFDARPEWREVDVADNKKNLRPYLARQTPMFFKPMPAVSHSPQNATRGVWRFIFLEIDRQQRAGFLESLAKIQAASSETDSSYHYVWYELIDGGAHPTYLVVLPRANWAGFDNPETEIFAVLDQAIDNESSFSAVYRAELSYTPETQ